MEIFSELMRDGMLGLAIGDALGVPVEFLSRERIASRPRGKVTGMEAYGTHHQPAGTWSDDTSMALATLESLMKDGYLNPASIMEAFSRWEKYGEYSAHGEVFDIGNTCGEAISNYRHGKAPSACGKTGEHANGNGALMRILPVCIYALSRERAGKCSLNKAVTTVHEMASLTHNHMRSHTACGIYYFIIRAMEAVKTHGGSLKDAVAQGYRDAVAYYQGNGAGNELSHYEELMDVDALVKKPEEAVRTGGYVVESLLGACWGLCNTSSYQDALLLIVNQGHDADTVAAIGGGLAGIWYGLDGIPSQWRETLVDYNRFIDDCEALRISGIL